MPTVWYVCRVNFLLTWSSLKSSPLLTITCITGDSVSSFSEWEYVCPIKYRETLPSTPIWYEFFCQQYVCSPANGVRRWSNCGMHATDNAFRHTKAHRFLLWIYLLFWLFSPLTYLSISQSWLPNNYNGLCIHIQYSKWQPADGREVPTKCWLLTIKKVNTANEWIRQLL